ncbi:MAG: hypothetical protein AAB900_02415 [Patescibacteria group bacterium]
MKSKTQVKKSNDKSSLEEHDTTVRVPVIAEPSRAPAPLVTVPVHVGHAPAAIRVAKRRAEEIAISII